MIDGKILVIDDNHAVLSALELLLEAEYSSVITMNNPNEITSIPDIPDYDFVLLDMNFSAKVNSGNEGFYWLRHIHKIAPELPVVMITAYGDVALAIRALKEGAVDFVLKPWDNKKLLATLQSAYRLGRSRREVGSLKKDRRNLKNIINQNHRSIIGNSRALHHVLKIAGKVAKTEANVLITGENGTGKELIAREVHKRSPRNAEVFVSVDMGSVPETLFESELFGHVKGAFTDAKEDRCGKFEAAHGGTLFLDEIGNLPVQLQSKLLSVIQNREVTRVGSNTPVPVDIRLICATNRHLDEMVNNGTFREDLLYRINTIHIEAPPLRDRGEDILLLADFFVKKYGAKYGKGELHIHENVQQKLLNYGWPGNIRELQHTMERSVILSENNLLKAGDILLEQRIPTGLNEPEMTLDEMERNMIANALARCHGNYTAAAKQLGITRQTLYNKTRRYGL